MGGAPFALFPTLFWVRAGRRKWWGNCTWCSMGIAALTKKDTRIYTKLGGEEKPFRIDIADGKVVQKNLPVHFTIPAKRFWDNVIYTCANILTFRNEEEINSWCRRHRVAKGEILTLGKLWELSKLWYSNYLEENWVRKTPEYAESIFKKVGLTNEFWKMK